MLLYKLGEIVHKNFNNIIFESKGEGFLVTICNESRYSLHEKMKLYFYEYSSDYLKITYGFKDFKERLLFLDLLTIDKIGPKIAMNMLDKGWEYIADLIANDQWQELSKIQFISDKTARYICVELAQKWSKMLTKKTKTNSNNQAKLQDLAETLNTLGFKKKQIDFALTNVVPTDDLEQLVEKSIELITTRQNEYTT
ncbi:Holliday junction branch migration protein RuvA [Mycoplasmopsis sturni]|uniref:Holliday junction branch migration protein RuvA n=1 Tax=Mycoplasmopsis sturni TaxID=39047 RepID=UPI0005619243|nr:Holliday junction branch migration protein RuvA [Mycoplasmopsis sturni]